jgi:hypothetical protein
MTELFFSDANLDWLLDQLQLRLIEKGFYEFYSRNEVSDEEVAPIWEIKNTDAQCRQLCDTYNLNSVPKRWVKITTDANVYSVEFCEEVHYETAEPDEYILPATHAMQSEWMQLLYDIENWLGVIPIIKDHLPHPMRDKLVWINQELVDAALSMGCPEYRITLRPTTLIVENTHAQRDWVHQMGGLHYPPNRMVGIANFGNECYNITYFDDAIPEQDDIPTRVIPNTVGEWREIYFKIHKWLGIVKSRGNSGG